MKKKSFDAVDFFKWICGFLVMYIHMKPLAYRFPAVDIFLAHGICRIAVPFYFAASALLLFRKMEEPISGRRGNIRKILNFCGHILILYTIWSLIYIGYRVFFCWYNGLEQDSVLDYLRRYFFIGERYHMWYLIASVYAVPAVYLLWKAGKKALIGACLIGNLLQCVDQFLRWGPVSDLPFLEVFRDEYSTIYFSLLRAIPMMCLGVLCLMHYQNRSSKQWLLRIPGAAVLLFAEITLWYLLMQQGYSIDGLLTAPLLVYYLTNWLFTVEFQFPVKWLGKALRYSNTWNYCVHPLWILLYTWVFSYEGVFRYAVVVAVTVISSVPYVACKIGMDQHSKKTAMLQQKL